ncbi:MAG: transketolase [Clostridiales bacterium]|jgi:transketolase|nr:transketolase [Clostridiales bacterium]
MNTGTNIDLIREKAAAMRRDCLEMGYAAGSHGAHFGPALSSIEIVASLYFGIMNHDPKNPCLLERDRFVMSKGHACLSYYAALVEAGYLSREEMYTFKGDNSILSGHPSCHVEHGLEVATGSLGNGFAIACGMAKAAKIKRETHTVYCVLGDGECDEGVIWEAAMNAVKNKLDNLVGIIDRNSFQLAGKTHEIMDLDLAAIWKAFGWDVFVVEDGNDVESLLAALKSIQQSDVAKPHLIIAKTVKGKGISFMENNLGWHAAPINQEQYEQAQSDLELA